MAVQSEPIFASDRAPSEPKPRSRIAALDGLRGIAALMVLLHHTLLMLPDFANAEWLVPGAHIHGALEWLLIRTPLRLMWSGQVRALLFFVLSGLVLALPWVEGRSAPYGRFLLGRFCRIYPPYLIAMIIAATGSILLGGRELAHATIFFNQLGWAFPPSWEAVPSVAGVLDNRYTEYMNEGMWTLVWEVRVAFIFPLLMFPILRWGNRGILGVLAALILLNHVAARSIGASLSDTLDAPQKVFYYAQFFLFGVAIAANRATIARAFSRWPRITGPACLILGCLVCWIPWPMADERMVALGAAIILAAIVGSVGIQSCLVKPALLWLGKRSYSLYLIHLPLIMSVIIFCHGQVPIMICGAIIPAAIGLSWAFNRWVEIPSVTFAERLTGYSHRAKPASNAAPLPITAVAVAAPASYPDRSVAR